MYLDFTNVPKSSKTVILIRSMSVNSSGNLGLLTWVTELL